MTVVQKLKDLFSNFEKEMSKIPNNKTELSGSKTSITIDKWYPRGSSVRQGVNFDFVRFYRGTTNETKEMTLGFSFNFSDDAPITVAVYDKQKRYIREISVEEFKAQLKELTKVMKEESISGFLPFVIKAHDIFRLQDGIQKEYNVFNVNESLEKALSVSEKEQKAIQESLDILATLNAEEKEIEKKKNEEIKEAIRKIEEAYAPKLKPVQDKIEVELGSLEEKEIAYVESLKSTFDNYDMGIEKYLMHLTKEKGLPYPGSIVNHIMPKE